MDGWMDNVIKNKRKVEQREKRNRDKETVKDERKIKSDGSIDRQIDSHTNR